jgi:hypothetical protein
MKKIFQIGFNRCGTRSLCSFFEQNDLKSIHFDKGNIAKTIYKNSRINKPLLSEYEDYDFISDMEFVSNEMIIPGYKYFIKLNEQYDSVFILNIRNINDWINSRLKHSSGSYLIRYMNNLNKNKQEVIEYWKEDWYNHINALKNYFKDKDNLLIFDIVNDKGVKIKDFLYKHNINITNDQFGHVL